MSNQNAIFWFSGTGNSLYIAKQLSAQLNGLPLISMAGGLPPDGVFGGNAAKIGFVFPAYYNNLPRDVRSFIEKLDVEPDTYIFAVITMDGFGNGTLVALRKAFSAKGLKLCYGVCIHMPPNFIRRSLYG
jgi:flavodoxin